MIVPELRHFCDLEVQLGPVREMGEGRNGTRRIVPITGGSVSGNISGKVLDLGADWQTTLADGSTDIDTRYAVQTDNGAVIEIVNKGVRHGPPEVLGALARGEDVDPALYYFRTSARLETGDERFTWVNRTIFVGTGRRLASAVQVSLFAVN
ncbi:DUF3237 domain-containing protein [Labrenzia sp. VG12]|uniref:DUF3237 domain-containing protein n=1 Tax=Labrenzia sp. VG12 TaxID=2021862 RepID=UPI000B8C1C63|nr:DUF3237 domain-containing protein [Labrenzia sp. VG12]ASP34255.1 hypothetical protein CHH27_14195 [Labrenzia sp. VG12]